MLRVALLAVVIIGASAGLTVSVKPVVKPVGLCPDGRSQFPCFPRPGPLPGPCPSDKPFQFCKADPCRVAKCPGAPDAKCVSNFCGGCTADFLDERGVKINCDTGCPVDKPLVACFADPCSVTSCPAFPNARCVSNFCGGCNAFFFDKSGKRVDCNGGGGGDPPCLCNNIVDPCSDIARPSCPRFPKAKCETKCCKAVFTVNGKEVQCKLPGGDGRCFREGQKCTEGSAPTPWLASGRKIGGGLQCCLPCGPPVARQDDPPLVGECKKTCPRRICPIG